MHGRSYKHSSIIEWLRMLTIRYLGYWVQGSDKMDYKIRFSPLEALTTNGWERLD